MVALAVTDGIRTNITVSLLIVGTRALLVYIVDDEGLYMRGV